MDGVQTQPEAAQTVGINQLFNFRSPKQGHLLGGGHQAGVKTGSCLGFRAGCSSDFASRIPPRPLEDQRVVVSGELGGGPGEPYGCCIVSFRIFRLNLGTSSRGLSGGGSRASLLVGSLRAGGGGLGSWEGGGRMIGGAGVLPGSNSVAPLFSLRLLRTRGLDEYGPYRVVCRLATPGFPFEWRAGVLEGLGSWGRGGRVSRGTLVVLIVVSCLLLRPLDDQTHRGAEASFWGLSIGGSRASL